MLKKFIIPIIIKLFRVFIPINKKKILYYSFPDVSDNSFAFFVYLINNHPSFENVWLVDSYDSKEDFKALISNYTTRTNFVIIKKKTFKGIKEFISSKYILHTHGLFNEVTLSCKQTNINLWHGMPLKKIGHLDDNKRIPKSDFLIATSELFADIMAKAFKTNKKSVLVSGLPRNDFLFELKHSFKDLLVSDNSQFKNTILWMPTYRKSVIGDIRNDGETRKIKDFLEDNSLSYLNSYLQTINTVCFIKLHPMDFMKVEDFNSYSNIYFINDEMIRKKGVTMYSLLNSVDLLLTDFSSIYVDFLLLDKPIGFIFSDFEEYLNSRGFVFQSPLDYMPGEIITDIKELKSFMDELFIQKNDNFILRRNEIKKKFHNVNSDFSAKLFTQIFDNAQKYS
ncbi:CDP-glycerol glycerophosphotransferase family protein [Aestuariibaculum marinum]|uniref:CDP-glycerol glycerophosphotransferase family protein n=1 Tax=Aestuariibaculum marinum TaxID=2683592 RepID=A0A8J6Q1P9_9FLAO|nr:CDP-glycerol glycerophosphotransferase family protein [Aestuariibaculum marinum]MBD0823359.1 CDP-glycerol glycerophosphotransferase family protein [Aestuariibaculum marinum]